VKCYREIKQSHATVPRLPNILCPVCSMEKCVAIFGVKNMVTGSNWVKCVTAKGGIFDIPHKF